MPGKRYKLCIIDGPFKGSDCLISDGASTPFPEGVNVEVRDGTRTALPLRWLKQKPPEVHHRNPPILDGIGLKQPSLHRRNRKEKP